MLQSTKGSLSFIRVPSVISWWAPARWFYWIDFQKTHEIDLDLILGWAYFSLCSSCHFRALLALSTFTFLKALMQLFELPNVNMAIALWKLLEPNNNKLLLVLSKVYN